jgi:transposase
MTRKRKPYKTYTKEFKEEAVRLMASSNRPAAETAMELGIRRNQLYKWKEQMENKGDKAFSGRGRPKKEDQSEMTSLRRENERLKEENEILKKAAAYFAKELK